MIQIEQKPSLPPLRHAWKDAIAVGTAHELLRADLQEHLRFLQKEVGFRRIRFHGLFHEPVGVCRRDGAGKIYYTWSQVDKIFDFLVATGFCPIVELNPMPAALASGEQTMFHYRMNVTPPKSWSEWEELVYAFTAHVTERYGQSIVLDWLFEVWNEPNLKGFWSGTMEEYHLLYRHAAQGVKRVDTRLRVGGPAQAGCGEYTYQLLEYCARQQVPIDFVSVHGYPQGEYCVRPYPEGITHSPMGMAMPEDFRAFRETLNAKGYAAMPVIVTEWNTQTIGKNGTVMWLGNTDVSTLFSGAAVCHHAVATDPYVDSFCFWVASDVFEESGPHRSPWGDDNQYYGILAVDGTPKPGFHAFKFLSRMRGPRRTVTLPQRTRPLCGALATDEGTVSRALFWNYHHPPQASESWNDTVRMPVPVCFRDATRVRVITAHVAAGTGSAFELWEAIGKPRSLSALEQQLLKAAATPQYRCLLLVPADGYIEVPLALGRNEMLFVEIASAVEGSDTGDTAHMFATLNRALDVPGE